LIIEFLGPEMEKVLKYFKQIKSRAYILRVKNGFGETIDETRRIQVERENWKKTPKT